MRVNMLCGKWETAPRDFAKCRYRKAKYSGKECQSRPWAEGHWFWCGARAEEEGDGEGAAGAAGASGRVPTPGVSAGPVRETGAQA